MRTPSKTFSAADAARLANFKPREASSGSFVSPRAGGAATRPATSPWSVAARAAAASPAGAAREAAARRGSRRDSPEAAEAAEALASPAAARRASSSGYPEAFPASFGAVACSSPGFGVDLVPREPCLYTLERFDKRRKTWRDGALRLDDASGALSLLDGAGDVVDADRRGPRVSPAHAAARSSRAGTFALGRALVQVLDPADADAAAPPPPRRPRRPAGLARRPAPAAAPRRAAAAPRPL